MAASEALTAVRAAKQELRKTLRQALTAMTDQQRKEESEKLVRKVQNEPFYGRQHSAVLCVSLIWSLFLSAAAFQRGVPVQ